MIRPIPTPHPACHMHTDTVVIPLDLGPPQGPAVMVKDTLDVAGVRTGAGSAALDQSAPAARHAQVVQQLLDAVNAYLPSPLDIESVKGINPKTGEEDVRHASDEEPFAGLAFKIATDPFVGKLAFFRVYSGHLAAGSYVLNTTTGNKERIGRLVRLHANSRQEIEQIEAGVVALGEFGNDQEFAIRRGFEIFRRARATDKFSLALFAARQH